MSLLNESWTLCNEVLARAGGHGDRLGRLSGSGSMLWLVPLPAVSASVVLRVAPTERQIRKAQINFGATAGIEYLTKRAFFIKSVTLYLTAFGVRSAPLTANHMEMISAVFGAAFELMFWRVDILERRKEGLQRSASR